MLEPKRKHTGMVVGVAIAVALGVIQGTKMAAGTTSDFIALVVAFLILIVVFGSIGYLIDSYMHKRNKQDYSSFVTQQQFNYGEEQTSTNDNA